MTTTVDTLSIEDRLAIQDLVARYNFYVDTKQIDSLMGLFVTEDPTFDETRLGIPCASGFENLRQYYIKDVFEAMEGLAHLTGGYLIEEVTDKGARGVCTISSTVMSGAAERSMSPGTTRTSTSAPAKDGSSDPER